ncbi:MAG: hypothetical protein J6A01_07570 [Proteobacteria bacterium]|nr:hypothetical protein [Pseudomonadota bacterium]
MVFGTDQKIEAHKKGTHQESCSIPLAEQPYQACDGQNEFDMLGDLREQLASFP